jgi:hypothetical protein
MAVLVIQEFEATREEYDKVSEILGDGTPEGAILHAGCNLDGDKWKSVDVWESVEAFQDFAQNKLIPAIAQVNPDAPEAGEPEVLEIYDLQTA